MKQKLKTSIKSAVALRYDASKNESPKVTAKGKGFMAEKILELAKANNVAIREDADLVEILSEVDLDQEIPPSLYKVVAELLAFVYQMNLQYKEKNI